MSDSIRRILSIAISFYWVAIFLIMIVKNFLTRFDDSVAQVYYASHPFFKMLPLLWIPFIAAFFYFSRKLILLNLQKYIYGLSLIIIIIGIIFLVINSTFISHSHDINEQVTSTLKSLN